MPVTVNATQAEKILRSAINQVQNQGWQPQGQHAGEIQAVILGTHKTYRYILLTGLLAKATNEACNPITLQAGSMLADAYDARSLCHGVVVPIERELLGDRLGASNEPFLNKPARFPELATTNAVRRGNDARLQQAAISVLSGTSTSALAKISLCDCLYWVFQRKSRDLADYLTTNNQDFQPSALKAFANKFASRSIEGETCALLAGTTYSMLGHVLGNEFDVRTHKVNQAGTSSNEISDVDVYESNTLVYTAEVKDKDFTAEDVEHAISKAAMAGHPSLTFIKGPRGRLVSSTEPELVQLWSEKGFSLFFVDIIDFFTSILSLTQDLSLDQFAEWLNTHADAAKVKDETFTHLTDCLAEQSN